MQPVILAASGVLDWRSCSSYPWTYVSSTTAQCEDEESWYQVWCHSFPHLDCTWGTLGSSQGRRGCLWQLDATGCNWMQLDATGILYIHIYPISLNQTYPGRRTKLRTSEFLDLDKSLPSTSQTSRSLGLLGSIGSIARFHKLHWEVDTFFTLRPEKDYLAVWCLRGDRNRPELLRCWGSGSGAAKDLGEYQELEHSYHLEVISHIHIILYI